MKIALIVLLILFTLWIIALSAIWYTFNMTQDSDDLKAQIHNKMEDKKYFYTHGELIIGIYKDGRSNIQSYSTSPSHQTTWTDGEKILQIGSLSKVFTTSLLQILADRWVIHIDDNLQKILWETYRLSPQVQTITLRELATHTSGFENMPASLTNKAEQLHRVFPEVAHEYSLLTEADVFQYLQSENILSTKGSFSYSNFWNGLIGHILEHVTWESLNALMTQYIFTPLDMQDSSLIISDLLIEKWIGWHWANGENLDWYTFNAFSWAGWVYSNVDDMLQFLKAQWPEPTSITKSLQKTHQQQANKKTWLGWMQPGIWDRFIGNHNLIWHNGMVGWYASYMSFDRTTWNSLVILSSTAIDVSLLWMELSKIIQTHSWK